MGEKQDELEMLEEEYIVESAQLKELEEKLGVCTCNLWEFCVRGLTCQLHNLTMSVRA